MENIQHSILALLNFKKRLDFLKALSSADKLELRILDTQPYVDLTSGTVVRNARLSAS